MTEPTAPVIRAEVDRRTGEPFRYPHDGARIGAAWVFAWTTLFAPGADPVRRDVATAAMAAETGLSERTVRNILDAARKAGLLAEAVPKIRRTDPPWLVRATLAEAPPEYAVRKTEVH